jgi:hypothetical protein
MNNVWRDSRGPLDRVHRIGAVAFGLGLWVFGGLGLLNRLDTFSTTGGQILGLSSNGLLSMVSLVVGAVLIGAAFRGGRTASTVTTAVGAAFLLSGVVNVLLLGTPANILAFRMSNVIFSLVSGGLLLVLGSYGRFTGRLPESSPYRGSGPAPEDADGSPDPMLFDDAGDAAAARELADAERAVALHTARPEVAARVRATHGHDRFEDRVRSWRDRT